MYSFTNSALFVPAPVSNKLGICNAAVFPTVLIFCWKRKRRKGPTFIMWLIKHLHVQPKPENKSTRLVTKPSNLPGPEPAAGPLQVPTGLASHRVYGISLSLVTAVSFHKFVMHFGYVIKRGGLEGAARSAAHCFGPLLGVECDNHRSQGHLKKESER